jgi:mono/diheme cytochrome c family protein
MWRQFTTRDKPPRGERGDQSGRAAIRAALVTALLILLVSVAALTQEVPDATPEDPRAASVPSTEEAPAADAVSGDVSPPQPAVTPAPAGDPIAEGYLRLCAGCHTIGGGPLSGPDLLPSTGWARADLRVAVKRMETNVGPMSDEQVDGLTDLLKSPDLEARLDAARERRIQEMAATLEPGQAAIGRQLFFGTRRFSNGGMGCYGCHAAAGLGGNMAKDLTTSHTRLGAQSLISATENPAFPMMVAAYGSRRVTSQEAVHLAAFLEETAGAATPETAAQPESEAMGMAHAGAGVLFLAVIAGVALAARARRAGVRERMVRDSFRR